MTIDEAQLYLPVEDLDELDDVYDVKLHELRNFFLSQVPVRSVFESKIKRMQKMQEAYQVLAGEVINDTFEEIELLPYDQTNVFDLTVAWQQNLSLLRFEVAVSESFPELEVVAGQLLENMRAYAACWNEDFGDVPEDIRMTRPEDEVELLVELERLSKMSDLQMKDVASLDADNIVRREAIRLSLWNKREADDRTI